MKQSKLWLSITSTVISVFNVLCFYAIHSMWSGIIAILGKASPYIIIALMFLIAVASLIILLSGKRYLIPTIIFSVLTLFFFVVECYIISVAYDSYKYFLREFAIAFGFTALIALLVFLLFYYPKTKLANSRIFKFVLVFVLVFGIFFGYFGIIPNQFETTPVVYAVEEEYQIVFITSAKSTAWVKVGDKEYNATYAGSRTSQDRVHKVCVPMEELDNAGGYTIFSRAMILRGPYSAMQGVTISQEYNWRGIDTENGLNYYVLSDTHTEYRQAIKAGNFFGDKLDFLICCGDTANWLDTIGDVVYGLRVMGGITRGEIPTVYARGNHETKGLIADELYKFVGSVNQNFYFTFKMQNIWGVVLDLGEDHGDNWAEFYDSSRFDQYRADQTEFLDTILDNKDDEFDAEGIDYRIGICHIPITFKYAKDHAGKVKDSWIERLNQMKLTMMFAGHRHQLMYVEPNAEPNTPLYLQEAYAGYTSTKPEGYTTNASFPLVMVSRKSNVQQIDVGDKFFEKYFIGLAVTSDGTNTTMRFTTKDNQIVSIVSPWIKDKVYGSQIVVPNK
ncbi:MAG: metallophosphoesterase [Clostridia bacterium]